MKEVLYTIPLMDAFRAEDECPFCFIERNIEQHAIDFVLGSEASYMEEDIREQTDKIGFCKDHLKKMFTYGNNLGNALILETHMRRKLTEIRNEMKHYSGAKVSFLDKLGKDPATLKSNNNVSKWIHAQEESCYVCNHMKQNYDRYMATFFVLYKRGEKEFIDLVKKGKGFCLPHLADILDRAPMYLNDKEQKELRDILFPQMEENLSRIIDDLDWLEKKYDYRYRDAEWKNSKDAVQRAMQKMGSGYPADPPYQQN